MRFAARTLALALTAVSLAVPATASAQARNPIDDLLKLAGEAFNDFKYTLADSLARSVLTMNLSTAQRERANMVIAASAYPEEASAQRRAAALTTLKQLVRANYNLKFPQELTWVGLDSLLAEAKRTTFSLAVTAQNQQVSVGLEGTAKIHVKSNKPGFFRVTIMSATGNSVAVVDSISSVAEGDITFRTMRSERPIFSTGDYKVIVTAFEPGARGDTVTSQYTIKADAPELRFLPMPTVMDSSKLLKERAGRSGAKSIFPALLAGGAAFAFSSVLRGEGDIANQVEADSKGPLITGVIVVGTIVAGFRDKGRLIPANIAANKAAGEAFQKSIVDVQAENRRRITEYKTTLTFEMEGR